MLDRSVITEILAKTDLVTLVGNYVALRRQGQDFTGLCPFHAERSPSFHVRGDRGYFKCFGCGVGGDAIRFIENIESLSFLEAARLLAKRVGVELEQETPASNQARELRDAIYAANVVAAQYFQRELHAPGGLQAREYLTKRGFSELSRERFTLGFAPETWHGLRDALRAAGIHDDIGVQAGLLREGPRGTYDFYRNRAMIPTLAVTGEIIAFGGRALGDDEPKYLNTATTPVYSKGKVLFGLSQARRAVATAGALIVVEGYFDCIALHQAGFEHAVASLGTAFTAEQAALIKRFTANVYLAFDADRAGQNAMLKSLEILDAAECKTRVIDLPAGADPDSVVQSSGTAGFQALLDSSRPATEVLLEIELDKVRDGFHEPAEIVAEAERLVRRRPRAEWDRWRVYVAERLGLSINDVRRAAPVPGSATPAAAGAAPTRRMVHAPPSRERDILRILLEEPALAREYHPRLGAARIRDPKFQRLYQLLTESEAVETTIDILALASTDALATAALLELTSAERSSAVRFADGEQRRAALDHIVAAGEREDDERRRREYAAEIDALLLQGAAVPPELIKRHRELEQKLVKIVKSGR